MNLVSTLFEWIYLDTEYLVYPKVATLHVKFYSITTMCQVGIHMHVLTNLDNVEIERKIAHLSGTQYMAIDSGTLMVTSSISRYANLVSWRYS